MKNIALMTSVILALVGFLIFWESPPQIFVRQPKAQLAEAPKADSYMRATITRKFDGDGRLSYTLESSDGEYFKQHDRLELQHPILLALRNEQGAQPWHLTADKGIIFNTRKRVTLSGKVNAWQTTPTGKNQLRTPELTYFPDTNMAETQSTVVFVSPNSRTTARGLQADLEQQTYQLLSQVKSIQKLR